MTTIHTLPLRPREAAPQLSLALAPEAVPPVAPAPAPVLVTNATVARALDRAADMLAERGANEHRVAAYRRAALAVRDWPEPVGTLVRERGAEALEALPGVGERLSRRIAGFVETGELSLLRELRAEMPPARVFARVPGVGRATAKRLVEELGVETLEGLEAAAHDGRLAALPGFGPRRVKALRAQLAEMLQTRTARRDARAAVRRASAPERPSVADLLDVDAAYRYHADRGDLPTIAPRRFNASGDAWLPVLHTRRGPWRITALFSNTPRAHEVGKVHDWVVLYATGEDGREQTFTAVTEGRGPLRGRRVVRGREAECADFHARADRRLAA